MSKSWVWDKIEVVDGMVTIPAERYERMRSTLVGIATLGFIGGVNCHQCKKIDEAFIVAKNYARSCLDWELCKPYEERKEEWDAMMREIKDKIGKEDEEGTNEK